MADQRATLKNDIHIGRRLFADFGFTTMVQCIRCRTRTTWRNLSKRSKFTVMFLSVLLLATTGLWKRYSFSLTTIQAVAAIVDNKSCRVTTEYISSDLEKDWLSNVHMRQGAFCNSLESSESSTARWLQVIAENTQVVHQQLPYGKSPAQILSDDKKLDSQVFSSFKTTYDCGPGKSTTLVTWIEPLSHSLRHPNALCGRGAHIMDRGYLMLTHHTEVEAARKIHGGCHNRTCQAIYFDLGASIMVPGKGSQGWFFKVYKQHGIAFDRFLVWEAKPTPPAKMFRHVPKADLHKYQYYNIPVTANTSDPSNPVHILKAIAQPGDFVVFKLDIDNFRVEHAILDALVADPEALALVDEFFFEEHVAFLDMQRYWGPSVGPNTSLASSYAMFHKLRAKGLRAHAWV